MLDILCDKPIWVTRVAEILVFLIRFEINEPFCHLKFEQSQYTILSNMGIETMIAWSLEFYLSV